MLSFRLANPARILLSAAAVGLLTVFAPAPFLLDGSALAQDDPPVNFRITSYGDTWCGIEFDVPRNRGITQYDVYEYKHDGNEFILSDSIDDVPASGGSNNQWAYSSLTPDTQYKFVLLLKDDSGKTIIEKSVTVRTLPTSGESTLSTDTSLSSLSLSGIDIGSFSASKRVYSATVANDVTQTTVSATANHTGASYVIWPNADGVISLSVGRNDITITVTAEDGTSTRSYKVFVTRAGTDETPTSGPNDPTDKTPTPAPSSTDATLSSLSLSGIDFSPPFSQGRYHYNASVAEDVTETTVTAMPDKPEASYVIKLNGEVKDDGFIPLSVGISVITIAVTAEDGSTSQTYTVTVTRQEAIGELPTDNPPVNFRITSYGDTWCGIEFDVPRNRGITQYDVYEYKHDGNEFILSDSIDDVPASGGSNNQWAYSSLTPDTQYKFVLLLKDDSGKTIIEKSVTVRTLPTSGESTLSTDTSLSSLSLSGIDIGSFSASKRVYSATVANDVTQTTVSATANHTGASYVIWPNADGVISLSVGRNDITITVTAEDGTSTRIYRIFVTRAGTDGTPTPDPSEPTNETQRYVVPYSLEKVSGDSQEGPASTQLAEPFVVVALDEDGAAMAGALVTFSVTAGGGMLSSTTVNPCTFKFSTSSITGTTDANGQAMTRLTLGSEPGTNTVEATVAGLNTVMIFTATAAEQAMPHSLAKVCGDEQEGTADRLLAQPLVVLVSDEEGAAMAGVVVSFSVTAGEGTLLDTTDTTDADGFARAWLTPGSEPGTNTVVATVEGLEPVTFTATGQESPLAGLFDSFFGSGKLVALPDNPQLAQNAPNPFNSQTVLSYFLLEPGPTRLEIFALTGQRVAVLHQGPQQAGYHRLRWDGRDAAGRPLASGIYLYRLVTDEGILTRKLTLLR